MPRLLPLFLLVVTLVAAEPPTADAAKARQQRVLSALRHRDWEAARREVIGTAEHAALALYAGWPVPAGADDLAPLPRDPADLGQPEAAWPGAVAPRARPLPPPVIPGDRDRGRPLVDVAAATTGPDEADRSRDGLTVGQRLWQILDIDDRVEARCLDDGALRWFTRWRPEPGLGAPGRAVTLADGRLLVGEGDARLLVLDASTGAVILDIRPHTLPLLPGRTWLRPAGAVVLHPPGLDDRLGWITADGGERDERLPGQARWVLTLPDGEVWLALADGRALAACEPGAWSPLSLPPDLIAAEAPRLVADGVAADRRVWAWRR